MTEKYNMPFEVKDCALVSRMAGLKTAVNLRELRDRIDSCPIESLFHHFCETVVRPSFDDPEFRNDFAVWAARDLGDRVLAERLGIINPYQYQSMDEIRGLVIDIIEERLSEMPHVMNVSSGNDFRFMRAVTVVFDTGKELASPPDFVRQLPKMSHSSLYYHYVEARRRTPDSTDDFTAWLLDFGDGTSALRADLAEIDFYHLSLAQLQKQLIAAVQPYREAGK
ncbi:MAG: DUF5752 family protein [bacterium]